MLNPVVISVCIMLGLALFRVNVVLALTISAIFGGLFSGLGIEKTAEVFQEGLGGGAEIALSYAMLGTFAVALSKSGITDVLANAVIKRTHGKDSENLSIGLKYFILICLILISMSSQNIVPVHIAFIPILIPPLLKVFTKLKIDRRMIACILTFGLITPYMVLPIGFGGIFLNEILLKNIQENGLTAATAAQVPMAMLLPGLGMIFGLLVAVFFSYKKPRTYQVIEIDDHHQKPEIQKKNLIVALAAIIAALIIQLWSGSMIFGALSGFIIFVLGGVIKRNETQDTFTQGVHMMAMIGFIMITASGFAAVMKASGGVESLVQALSISISHNKPLAAFLMLLVGLLVTMGIGSSFSTIPIITTIYVPLAISFGFSPLATISLVGTAAALGDAGSPASDSTLGPTSGLNADGQHEHIWETVVPTFIHYNIPLLIFGWIAAMVL